MPNYDILFHVGAGNPHFLDGGLITLKPFQSYWAPEELALGTKAVMNITPANIDDVMIGIIDYKVNDKANPNSISRGR
jgi:hypothetical protein